MQDLTPVGLTQDGKRLILVSSAGEEFAVPVDTRLREAMRGNKARSGQLEMKMDSALRPRDIQARIRAGESPEDVATAAQTSVDSIMVFASPVLAERAHVAQTAQRASVRRRSGESSSAGRTLGEAAELFFGDHTLHDEDVEWDAWRQAGGRWALVARYSIGGRDRTAEFSHDLPGRYVVAENDEARILTGELRDPGAEATGGGRSTQARRLSSVPSQDELPLGDDAIELVRDRESAADEAAAEGAPTAGAGHLTEVPEPGADTADADWIAEGGAVPPEESTSEDQRDSGPGARPDLESTAELSEDASDAGPGGTAGADEPAAQAAPKKKSRSSVPSWDEIMFGGKNE
jgi:Protein of unknown function (DUF3071)